MERYEAEPGGEIVEEWSAVVIASEAKQSIIAAKSGLLRRCTPRNDGKMQVDGKRRTPGGGK
jgi:hypothetical protein